ncbi:MAG TPA: hypothetical protein DDW41_02295 [Candidatus Andersenbacteria bacterium]|nr:MAG: Protein tyrosine/serine phosphatase [Parcubacteria group bacterium GW2011_GWA2_45_14]OGY34093.1 MAG: hypothetical protein A3B76_04360 [Candidatus Andersenbacteria bacterium RIFCSPHIGHO2_02_FULL_46_16]HBE90016.1 hypothetical protein [Candidatus Andersenbacteria bacterium]
MIKRLRWLTAGGVAGLVVMTVVYFRLIEQQPPQTSKVAPTPQKVAQQKPAETTASQLEDKDQLSIVFVGPRDNIPDAAPIAYGFWSFAVPVTGILSRSGQPLIGEFEWLAQQGWQGVVNLRVDGERDEVGDDRKLPGFSQLGMNYLALPMVDGHPPKEEQAKQFLSFVSNPVNQPVHVHCRGGIGRAGTMVALYRYAVQGWPMDQAIEESRAFKGGVSNLQEVWLKGWAQENTAGSYAN